MLINKQPAATIKDIRLFFVGKQDFNPIYVLEKHIYQIR